MIFTQEYNFQDAFGEFIGGFSVFLTGIIMVFFALVLLIFLIKIIGFCVRKLESKNQVVTQNEIKTNSVPVVINEIKEAEPELPDNELEIVAVITAVIAAQLGTTTDQLVVRSLKKVNRKIR
ncbi:MAG: OadG family protein [Cellulosilyticaceae bacterium]